MPPLRSIALAALLPVACGGPPAPGSAGASGRPKPEAPRPPAETGEALRQAEKAYLAGDWGEAVVQSTKVMEGTADQDEYYAAIRYLGLAACNRRDERPARFALKRLLPADRDHVRTICEQNGLKLPSDEELR